MSLKKTWNDQYDGEKFSSLKDKNLFIEVEKIKYPVEILSKPLNTKDFRKV